MNEQKISAVALQALSEALVRIYWYKSDLRRFLRRAVQDPDVLTGIDFDGDYKRVSVEALIDRLAENSQYLGTARALMFEVSKMTDFSHLERLDDGAEKAQLALDAVGALRKLVETHDKVTKQKESIADRRKREAEHLAKRKTFKSELAGLRTHFIEVVTALEPKARGYALERVMRDLFELFDLDPKASFKVTGEQVDGAFVLDGTDYLFEAKWQKAPVAAIDLDSFNAKVKRKLENTLGLFLSMNDFSDDGVSALTRECPNLILATGEELLAVLEQRIDFVDLLSQKKRHAARTGEILFNPLRR